MKLDSQPSGYLPLACARRRLADDCAPPKESTPQGVWRFSAVPPDRYDNRFCTAVSP